MAKLCGNAKKRRKYREAREREDLISEYMVYFINKIFCVW